MLLMKEMKSPPSQGVSVTQQYRWYAHAFSFVDRMSRKRGREVPVRRAGELGAHLKKSEGAERERDETRETLDERRGDNEGPSVVRFTTSMHASTFSN